MSSENSDEYDEKMELLPPPIALLRTIGDNVDINWLWRSRLSPRLRNEVIKYFYSPSLHQLTKEMDIKHKQELLIERRTFKKLKNLKNTFARRKQQTMKEVLKNHIGVNDLLNEIAEYMYNSK